MKKIYFLSMKDQDGTWSDVGAFTKAEALSITPDQYPEYVNIDVCRKYAGKHPAIVKILRERGIDYPYGNRDWA